MTTTENWEQGRSAFDMLLSVSNAEEKSALKEEEPNLALALLKAFGEVGLHSQMHNSGFEEATKVTLENAKTANDLCRIAKNRVLKMISAGEIVALGFEPPRRQSSAPVVIPEKHFRTGIHWQRSEVRIDGLHYIQVRIVPTSILELRNQPAPAPKRKIGRPSLKTDLLAGFDALAESGQISGDKSFASQVPKMREWLKINRPEIHVAPDQISVKTFQSHLSNRFNALKAKIKE